MILPHDIMVIILTILIMIIWLFLVMIPQFNPFQSSFFRGDLLDFRGVVPTQQPWIPNFWSHKCEKTILVIWTGILGAQIQDILSQNYHSTYQQHTSNIPALKEMSFSKAPVFRVFYVTFRPKRTPKPMEKLQVLTNP